MKQWHQVEQVNSGQAEGSNRAIQIRSSQGINPIKSNQIELRQQATTNKIKLDLYQAGQVLVKGQPFKVPFAQVFKSSQIKIQAS